MKDLSNKVALITGAGSGIGEQIALHLAKEGCNIIVTDINLTEAERVAKDIKGLGRDSTAILLDVGSMENWTEVAEQAFKWKNGVDILVNNAGFMIGGSITEVEMAMWEKITQVNIFGVVNGIKAFEQHMKQRGSGHITNISSLFGLMHLPYVSTYAMTKAAIVGLTNALRPELAAYGIGVTLVCPGSVSTKLVDNGSWSESKGGNFIPEMFAQHYTSPPEKIAKQVVAGIKKDKAIVMAGTDAKVLSVMLRFLPSLFRWSLKKLGKELKED